MKYRQCHANSIKVQRSPNWRKSQQESMFARTTFYSGLIFLESDHHLFVNTHNFSLSFLLEDIQIFAFPFKAPATQSFILITKSN